MWNGRFDEGKAEGKIEGLAEGLEKGLEKGAIEKERAIILQMLAQGLDVQMIANCTGVSLETILQIRGK
jgi:predicted transposase/invertase (TIGR01784 family)